MEVKGQIHASATLPPGKESLKATQPVCTLWRKQKYVPIQEIETWFPGFQAHSFVTVFTELPIYRYILKFGYAYLNPSKSSYIRE
jgi:hypothetical protein